MKKTDNRRIAKNTFLLYFRMLLMMAISLYTSRVVLHVLGVADYGLYNVVGGIVTVLAFLNHSMAGATQRFLNFQMGKGSKEGLIAVFNTAQFIHLIIAVVVVLLAETLGVWFLNNHMSIDPSRLDAANWVLQFSILSLLLTIISVPYNAAIIAHEKMSAFAYITIIQAVLKLVVVYILTISPIDMLILYSALLALISISIRILYGVYCSRNFEECKLSFLQYDKHMLKKMLGFSSWTILGAVGSVSHTQGIAIIINMFFGVTVNAAQGISNQVTHIVSQFVTNFMTALNPQIVKSYAADELANMHNLVIRGSKIGICLVAFFAIPIVIETPMILSVWLQEVPEYTVIFIRIVLITTLFNAYASPLAAAKGATGEIRTYQLTLTFLGLLHLPLAWAFFAMGYEPYYSMLIYFILINIQQVFRIFNVTKSIKMEKMTFVREVLIKSISMIVLSSIIPIVLHVTLPTGVLFTALIMLSGFVSVCCFSYVICLTNEEKNKIKHFVTSKIRK